MQEPRPPGGWADGKWYDVPMAFNLALPMCEAPRVDQERFPTDVKNGWEKSAKLGPDL